MYVKKLANFDHGMNISDIPWVLDFAGMVLGYFMPFNHFTSPSPKDPPHQVTFLDAGTLIMMQQVSLMMSPWPWWTTPCPSSCCSAGLFFFVDKLREPCMLKKLWGGQKSVNSIQIVCKLCENCVHPICIPCAKLWKQWTRSEIF